VLLLFSILVAWVEI
jgi:hypothetical protein